MLDRECIGADEVEALEALFRDEALELLDRLEGCLLDLESRGSDSEIVESSFRHLHTLKGIAAMYGFERLAALAHALETFFDEARRSPGAAVPDGAVRMSLESLDCMRALAVVKAGEADPAACHDADRILVTLAEAPAGPAQVELAGAGVSPEAASAEPKVYRLRLKPAGDAFFRGLRPESILGELQSLGTCRIQVDTSAVPELDRFDPAKLYLAWDVELRSEASSERVREALMFLHEDEFSLDCHDDGPHGHAGEERRRSDERRTADRRTSGLGAGEDTVRVPARRLDRLVDMVGELVTAHGALAALSGETAEVRLGGMSEEIGRLVGELRESVLEIRMVPIGTLFGRFRRHVRDLADDLGKQVEIVAEGAETEMDKGVLDRIGEPVLHILRNCIDHGIETAEERQAAGKSAGGTIRLAAIQSGGLVHLSISDDGRGLDLAKIRNRAVDSGLLAADAQFTDAQLTALLFSPGFSTSDTVTEVSGRGVGLDVVKRTLEDLNGSISISGVQGGGTQIRLSVPLTLAIIDGLLATVGEERFIIPLAVVESCAEAGQPDAWREHGRELLDVHGALVPLVRLRGFFGVDGARPSSEIAVISSVDGKRFGIVVDEVRDTIQAVIKPFGRYVRRVEGLSGTTVLGDGSAVPVVDPGDLLQAAGAAG